MRVYGLILCQDEATACTDLLEAFLAYFRAISNRNLRNNLEIKNARKKKGANVQKKVANAKKALPVQTLGKRWLQT